LSQNFEKANIYIYIITNDYNDDVYIGSTCNSLVRRYIQHKSDSKNEKYQNRPLYKLINEIGLSDLEFN
jgi:predicted GIY-YIG superfamily endonuclease